MDCFTTDLGNLSEGEPNREGEVSIKRRKGRVLKEGREAIKLAKEDRGRMSYPTVDPIMSATSQDLDILRLRKSDPVRIQYDKRDKSDPGLSIFSKYLLTTALAQLICENRIIAYARSVPGPSVVQI